MKNLQDKKQYFIVLCYSELENLIAEYLKIDSKQVDLISEEVWINDTCETLEFKDSDLVIAEWQKRIWEEFEKSREWPGLDMVMQKMIIDNFLPKENYLIKVSW